MNVKEPINVPNDHNLNSFNNLNIDFGERSVYVSWLMSRNKATIKVRSTPYKIRVLNTKRNLIYENNILVNTSNKIIYPTDKIMSNKNNLIILTFIE